MRTCRRVEGAAQRGYMGHVPLDDNGDVQDHNAGQHRCQIDGPLNPPRCQLSLAHRHHHHVTHITAQLRAHRPLLASPNVEQGALFDVGLTCAHYPSHSPPYALATT